MAERTEVSKIQELIYELKIEQVMAKPVITVPPDTLMSELKEVLRLNRISGVPVVENEQLVGVISIEDLIKALVSGEEGARVRDKMTSKVITVSSRDSVIEAVKIFEQYRLGRLPVLDEKGQLAGILTGGDITRGLLEAIRLDYHQEEISRYRASHIFQDIVSDLTSLILYYKVTARDFSKAGEASSNVKKALYRLGANPAICRRVAIATYESEMNLIIHTERGGDIIVEVHPNKVRVLALDTGPGIPDIQQALQPGFSTAPDWIRELGFGAGIGLTNIQRCADEMNIQSEMGVGTRLDLQFLMEEEGDELRRSS